MSGAIRPQRILRRGHTQPYGEHRPNHHGGQDIYRFGEGSARITDPLYVPSAVPYNPLPSIGTTASQSDFRISNDSALFLPTMSGSSDNISNTFNNVGRDMNQINVTSYGELGMDILYRKVVPEALHDSGESFAEPACHPGTRHHVLEQLSTWVSDTSPDSTLLWLHGSAGIGKSAIAQVFAGECQTHGRLGASFFFKRGQAVEKDKLLLGRRMPVQFDKLLVEPFSQIPALQVHPVVVIDGLDECEDHTVQQQMLRLFIGAIRNYSLPIRLLVCSRPEPHIREIVQTDETSAICREFALLADESAYDDIRTYLQDEFARIKVEYETRGIDLGTVWPTPNTLEHLVKQSSGTFIYAATVIRFIGDEYFHPAARLGAILALNPESTAPFDDLYTEILSVLPRGIQQLRILHALARKWPRMDAEQLDTFLNVDPGTSRLALRGLHSLFRVSPIRAGLWSPCYTIFPLHASLVDYLCDVRRSGEWCISIPWLHSDYLKSIIDLLSSPPHTRGDLIDRRLVVRYLPSALANTPPSDALISNLRNEVLQHSIFLEILDSECDHQWPQVTPVIVRLCFSFHSVFTGQRDSPYPPDLIQL
ncbi:hypothetical protein B0H19DRAFT_547308 [Mycena capillaripes]|nr:hypothetical protein B0H19DRAFT_547308 [Mycena capillaripes]